MTEDVDLIIVGIVAPFIVWAIWYYCAYKKQNKKQMYLATTTCATACAVFLFGALIGVIVGIVLGCIMDRIYKKNEATKAKQNEQKNPTVGADQQDNRDEDGGDDKQ